MNQRRGQIELLVNREGTVSFSRLKQAFPDVSEMTLRSDLRALDEERRIVRVYGGARSLGNLVGTDDAFDVRASRNTEEKRLIVKKALKLLRPGMAVFKWKPDTPAKFSDDEGDFCHIGLVTSVSPLRIVHASTEGMKVKADRKIGRWKYWGLLAACSVCWPFWSLCWIL